MLAKIFGILLGIAGLATTPPHSPATSALAPKTQTALVKTVEKTATNSNIKIKNDKPVDFTLVKSVGTVPKTASKTDTKSETKTVAPKAAGAAAGANVFENVKKIKFGLTPSSPQALPSDYLGLVLGEASGQTLLYKSRLRRHAMSLRIHTRRKADGVFSAVTIKTGAGDFTKVKSPAKVQKKKSLKKPAARRAAKTVPPKAAGAAAAPAAASSAPVTGFASTSALQPATTPRPSPPVDWTSINQAARETVVNIICVSKTAGLFEPLSGSGVIIDPRGIILTNAHVAQYLLLQDYGQKNFLTCLARAGSPAQTAYLLKLLYISPRWVANNYQKITETHPAGTGENDFALLEIAGSTNPDLNLPAAFPFLPVDNDENDIQANGSVALVSYPAGFLGGVSIQRELYLASTIVQIGKLFTFKTGTVDAFSLGGNPLAQRGSSGGAVVGDTGKLLGVIVTSTDAPDTSARELDAISTAHINRSLGVETSLSLSLLLTSDLEKFSAQFGAEVLPNLKKLFFDYLDSKNRR